MKKIRGQQWLEIATASFLVILLGISRSVFSGELSADLVIQNARIYTMDTVRSWAQALAVREGKIVAVGSEAEVKPYIGPATRVVDGQQNMVLPGLHDTHVHPSGGGTRIMEKFCTVPEALSGKRKETLAYVKACSERPTDTGGWLVVWNADGVSGADLDKAFPDRPVYLESAGSHYAVVNSVALHLGGIDADTLNPASGIIQRDPKTGQATGVLMESAMDFVRPLLPEITFDDFLEAVQRAMKLAASYGITSMMEATNSEDPVPLSGQLLLYPTLQDRGLLTVRMRTSLWIVRMHGKAMDADTLVSLAEKYDREGISTRAAKILLDGAGEGAAMLENFPGKDHNGTLNIFPQALNDLVLELDSRGIQIKFHAIGDRAVRVALDSLENALRINGDRGNRHHIDHTSLVHPQDRIRFAQLGVGAGFSPLWATPWGSFYEKSGYGNNYMPIRSIYEAGGIVIAGSDWSVSTMNPFPAIEAGITRANQEMPELGTLNVSERASLRMLLEMYTINGAWVMHQEQLTGSIEPGKAADVILLDRNLFEIPVEDISDTKVLMTIFNGEVVYER